MRKKLLVLAVLTTMVVTGVALVLVSSGGASPQAKAPQRTIYLTAVEWKGSANVAYQGERVTLNVFGVNAKFHDISMPDFNKAFRVERGKLSTVSFKVNKVGIFPIICLTHQPSHRADLVVLPKP